MAKSALKVLLMAGGTGGHVFPALAVARELQSRGAEVAWLGTARGLEGRLVPAAGLKLHCLSVQGVRGRGAIGLLKAPFLVLASLCQALGVMARFRPAVVAGFGGFASGPGGLAARLLWRPLVIHEQNAVIGTTNRLLAPLATRVLTGLPSAGARGRVVGNPVREELIELPAPAERLAGRADQPLRLLVLGGSLGARALNETLPEALAQLAPAERPEVWHQCGGDHEEMTRAGYAEQGVEARVVPFIEDMAEAYGWADWVICRAGALTVSELMAVGLAALLIPLPQAIDDHQSRNAAVLEEAGAAQRLPQREMSAEVLAGLIRSSFSDRAALQSMAERGRALARPEAAREVANTVIEVSRG